MALENQPVFEIGFATHPGIRRAAMPNQDYVKVVAEGTLPPFLIVADGMGGHNGGAIASVVVAEAMGGLYRNTAGSGELGLFLSDAVKAAHRALVERATGEEELGDMGTTVVAAILETSRVYFINVGDSRLYIFRAGQTIQLSRDQSWVAEQVRSGILTPEQAAIHPRRNQLLMSINAIRSSVFPYLGETVLQPDDIVLLCSDGLWASVPEAMILVAVSKLPPQKAADRLVDLANTNGGPDNISVIVAKRRGASVGVTWGDE